MNRLKDATSPYLLQHATNPVDWFQWCEEAFATAQREHKPILLSVGYSACHWCHVMAHESFEDPATAAIMNRDFVCIKVDREERPDVDDIYMQATLFFTRGHGGWPMTVFLAPDGRPFHAGTYFPKEDRYGMPSFQRVMAAVIDAWRNRPEQVEEIATAVTEGLQRSDLGIGGDDDELRPDLLDTAFREATRNFDPEHGGLTRGRPKFPSPMNYEFLLRYYAQTGNTRALEVTGFTLRKMAEGGIYDQLGGGFHRYSVDEQWLVPHFEKMLYDNAQLSRLYLHMWLATGVPFFKRIAEEVYDYILREMTSPEGAFYSTTDADSEGEEGKFFVWTPDEVKETLPLDEARAAIAYWGLTLEGNFEGANILSTPFDESDVTRALGISVEDLRGQIERAKDRLYAARTHRVHPGRDEKILTAWNGMMLASLAEAGRCLDRADYIEAAKRNAAFLQSAMLRDGRLMRSHKDGKTQFNAYLEDYANYIDGLLALYQATFDATYMHQAIALAEVILTHFPAPDGGFFDTSDDHESLIARPRNLQDNATPSGNALTAKVMALLAAYTGDARYEAAARSVITPMVGALAQYPTGFGTALEAASLLIYGIDEVAIIGAKDDPATHVLLNTVNRRFAPSAILAYATDDQIGEAVPPLLAYRKRVDGQSAAYVCRKFVCQQPVTTPEALAKALESHS